MKLFYPNLLKEICVELNCAAMLALTQYNFIDGVSMTVVLVLLLAFLYIQYAFSYWKRRGIDSLAGSFPLGNFGKLCRQKCTFGDLMMEFYRSSTQPIVGVYASMRPMLVVRDLELIRRVLNKDFHSFTNRGLVFNEKVDQLTINLFLMPYDDWRRMRTHVTPAFTPGKLKAMFSTLSDCALPLHQYLEQFVDRPQSVEMRDLSARYSTNVIASIAFGIEIDCITNKDDDFRKYGRIPFDLSFMNGFRHMMSLFAPKLMETLRIRTFDKKVADFMTAIVKQNLEYRETNNVIRKDFFQLLVQLRNNGKVGIDDDWSVNANKNKTLSIEEVAAQAFLFFAAGFETTSSVISFCLYELSKHPDVQDKLHADIDRVLAANDGELNYDTLGQMKYLDWCMDGMKSYEYLYIYRDAMNNHIEYCLSVCHIFRNYANVSTISYTKS